MLPVNPDDWRAICVRCGKTGQTHMGDSCVFASPSKWPTTSALLDLWRAPYSARYLQFAARRIYLNLLRGIPAPL